MIDFNKKSGGNGGSELARALPWPEV